MSEAPNPKMDELLKAYGRKRQEEAGSSLELHPVTRKLLQDEVRRVFPEVERRPPVPLWTLLWPRLAFGGALFGILMLAVMLAEKKTSSKNIALLKNFPVSRGEGISSRPLVEAPQSVATSRDALGLSASVESKAPQPSPSKANDQPKVPGTPMTLSRAEEKLQRKYSYGEPLGEKIDSSKEAKIQKKNGVSNAKPTVRETDVAAKQTSANRSSAAAGANDVRQAADKVSNEQRFGVELSKNLEKSPTTRYALSSPGEAEALKPGVTPSQTDALAISKTKADNRGFPLSPAPAVVPSQTLHFNQAATASRYRRNLQSPPMPNVLSSFQFDRFGDTARLTDADGSIYEGAINSPEAPGPPALVRLETALPDLKDAAAGTRKDPSAGAVDPLAIVRFQVSGTNRTLNQRVTFQGWVAPTSSETTFKKGAARSKASAEMDRVGSAPPKRLGQLTASPDKNSSNAATPAAMRIQGRVSVGGIDEFEVRANSSR